MKIRAALVVLSLVASACGASNTPAGRSSPVVAGSPASAASPLAAPSPSPKPAGLLFAVLETHPRPGSNPNYETNDTVAIVGLDGYARAKQSFDPRTVPGLCDAGLQVQPEARVAAGKVFYVDATGVVRSLDATGGLERVTTFAVQAQQMLSFAVDPSGTQLVGARLTFPTFTGPMPCQQQGQYAVDLYSATGGGNPQLGYHQAYAHNDASTNFIQAVGWDAAGALITLHTNIGTQQGPNGRQWFGQLAHWTPQGIGSVVGGSDCMAQDAQTNSIACISSSGEGAGSVRAPDGSIQWTLPAGVYYQMRLSPDATQASYCGTGGCGVAGKDGSHVKLPSTFQPTGWLDGSTVIGVLSGDTYGELATISLSDLTKVNDLGFKGMYVGVVQAS